MTTNKQPQAKSKEKKGINPVTAAVSGAVIGAGVAIVGALALKDKKTSEVVREAITKIKNQLNAKKRNLKSK